MSIEIENLGSNNKIYIHESVKKTEDMSVFIKGNNNVLRIGRETTLGKGIIEIRNNNSIISIGEKCLINGGLMCLANETTIDIGNKTTMMQALITLHEKGIIKIGEDCMLSGQIRMDVSDMHSILNVSSQLRINPPGNITIEDHVWIGHGVNILKGNTVGRDTILGAKAVVTSSIPNNSIAVGIPAKVVKSGITWDRKLLPLDE